MPFVLSIVGKSDSGKTTLILKLLPELEKRGYKVAVAKHCPHGFDLDTEDKDSWKFSRAGARGVYLTSGDDMALIRPREGAAPVKEMLEESFSDFDIVLMEGYNNEPGVKMIYIIREGIGTIDITPDNVIAYVSDTQIETGKPVFGMDDVAGVVDFIVSLGDAQLRG